MSSDGTERHPAEKAADEVLDEMASEYGELPPFAIAEETAERMRERWMRSVDTENEQSQGSKTDAN